MGLINWGLNHVDSQPHLFAMLRLNCVALRALSHFPLVNNSLKVWGGHYGWTIVELCQGSVQSQWLKGWCREFYFSNASPHHRLSILITMIQKHVKSIESSVKATWWSLPFYWWSPLQNIWKMHLPIQPTTPFTAQIVRREIFKVLQMICAQLHNAHNVS